MRLRLRKLADLVGIEPDPALPPEPEDISLSVKRAPQQRDGEEAKRRLEATRKRLKAQIPPPAG